MCGLTVLELGVERQGSKPSFWRIAERTDRPARVGEEKPSPLFVVSEYFRDAVRPASIELGRETGLERLHRCARLEPGDAAGERHAQYRGPRPLVHGLDRADGIRVHADPLFDGERIYHDPTMAPHYQPWPEFALSWPREYGSGLKALSGSGPHR